MKYAAPSETEWMRDRLGAPYSGVTAIVPSGYDAYLRLFHPAESMDRSELSLRWADVAAANGRVMHAGAQFHALATPAGRPVENELNGRDGPPGRHSPNWGGLVPTDFARLTGLLGQFTTTPRDMVCCLWDGYGGMPEPPHEERAQLPFREYLVLRGDIGTASENWFVWTGANGQREQTPNLWWPSDRAWCAATDIDFAWTLIGGSQPMAQAVLADPDLEVWPIEPTASVLIDGDRINVGATGPRVWWEHRAVTCTHGPAGLDYGDVSRDEESPCASPSAAVTSCSVPRRSIPTGSASSTRRSNPRTPSAR